MACKVVYIVSKWCMCQTSVKSTRFEEFWWSLFLSAALAIEEASRSSKFQLIYPSQRQNLLPTLEISTQNFHNFQNFGKKFQNLEFFSKISKTTKGPPLTSKGPPPPNYPITKFSFFSRVSKARSI